MAEFRAMRWLAPVALVLALAAAGCARSPADAVSGAGSAVPGSTQDFALNVGDRVYFTVDSSEINSQSASILDKQAQWLQRYPNYSIVMEGHADERGTREYNLALSARRANAAKNYLTSRGVPANRIQVTSYGKERPVAVCDAEQCWSQNRRAVTVLQGS